jgi:hypothetical protein
VQVGPDRTAVESHPRHHRQSIGRPSPGDPQFPVRNDIKEVAVVFDDVGLIDTDDLHVGVGILPGPEWFADDRRKSRLMIHAEEVISLNIHGKLGADGRYRGLANVAESAGGAAFDSTEHAISNPTKSAGGAYSSERPPSPSSTDPP